MLVSVFGTSASSDSQACTLKPIPSGAAPPAHEMYMQPSVDPNDAVSPVSMSPKTWLAEQRCVPSNPTPQKTQYGSSEPARSKPVSSFAWNETAFTLYFGWVGQVRLVRSTASRTLSVSFDSLTTRPASAVNRTAM